MPQNIDPGGRKGKVEIGLTGLFLVTKGGLTRGLQWLDVRVYIVYI
jgi:hypothetical protein